MKKKSLIIALVVTTVVLTLWLVVGSSLTNDSSLPESTENENVLRENQEQMAIFYQAPREALEMGKDQGTKECIEFWSSLRGLDLRLEQEGFPDVKQVTKSDLCASVPPALKNLHDHFNKVCGKDAQTAQCLVAVYYYRAALTDLLTKNQPVEKINDPKVLIDKMLANREVNPLLSVKAAERLSELEPGLYEARKAQVLGRLFMASQNKSSLNDQDWKELETSIERAKELGESDPELLEAELLGTLFREEDGKKALERAKEVAEDYPQEWRGPYYAAWALFKEGKGQESLDFLMEAYRRDPDNKRVKQALEGVKKGDANPFQGDISFSDLSQYF